MDEGELTARGNGPPNTQNYANSPGGEGPRKGAGKRKTRRICEGKTENRLKAESREHDVRRREMTMESPDNATDAHGQLLGCL